MQPHGVFYNKTNEGSLYNDGTSGTAKQDDVVRPNHSFDYVWTVPEHVAPTEDDPDCLTWVYSSGVDPIKDVYSGKIFTNPYQFMSEVFERMCLLSYPFCLKFYMLHYTPLPFSLCLGLIGPLLVCKKGTLNSDGKQKNVDKEFVLMFTVSNENDAWYIEKNVNEFIGSSAASSYEYGKPGFLGNIGTFSAADGLSYWPKTCIFIHIF